MSVSSTDALFVTANVGSIFEDPTLMLKIWCDEFLSTISRLNPKIIALHCQEVGGKNYEHSMQHVAEFVKLLMSSNELKPFDKVRIYLDEDYSSAEHFTALGNFYFIHESIAAEKAKIFNFHESKFEPVNGKEVYSENIEDIPTKEKSKFPQEIFPECKWSRKGFMRTRWNLNETVFDLINIHLFHDASNFVAMESFPSVYCKNRQKALEHTLKRFHTDEYGTVPFFVFGDFNFRTDTQGVVKKLSEGLNAVKVQSSKSTDHAKVQYRDESSQQVVLTLGKKEFSHQDHQKLFVGDDSEWLKEFDRELESFSGQLFEFDINFPPSYPYVEDSERGEMYMQTRCPSWCDRVFLSSNARMLVSSDDNDAKPEYGLIGLNACMGDHKPVYLRAALIGELGMLSCCVLPAAAPCTYCLRAASSVGHLCRLCCEQPVENSSFPYFDEPEQDQNGLVVPKFHRHTSPYTPESTDTEPDQGEEMSPTEELAFLVHKSDLRSPGLESSSRNCFLSSSDSPPFSEDNDNFSNDICKRKSSSKIPVRVHHFRESVLPSTPPVSKIPVAKEKDSIVKGGNVKHFSTSALPYNINLFESCKDNLDERLVLGNTSSLEAKFSHKQSEDSLSGVCLISKPSPFEGRKHFAKQMNILEKELSSKLEKENLPEESLISKPRSVEGRKRVSRQKNIDDQSSDSDTASLDMRADNCMRRSECNPKDSKVEIQLSLVDASPTLNAECESDAFLTTQSLGLGGSTTDSGVSVSPDLSVATSSADRPGEDNVKQIFSSDLIIDDELKTEDERDVHPLSLERFSFVRRIQSASSMERKSSFPLPSSVYLENPSSLPGLSGSGSNLWGMRTCRCMSDGSWRRRSSTESHSVLSSKADSRVRLISTSSNFDGSIPRLQSHHSSSEEDWFEEVSSGLNNLKPRDGNDLSKEEAKVKNNLVECAKRLFTHQEYISGKSSESQTSIIDGTDAVGTRSQLDQKFSPETLWPAPLHSKSDSNPTPTQFCPVKAEVDVENDLGEQLVTSMDRKFSLIEKERKLDSTSFQLMPQEEPKGRSKEENVQLRRASDSSESSRKSNSRKCKACCTIL